MLPSSGSLGRCRDSGRLTVSAQNETCFHSSRVREISGNYGIYLVWEQKFYEDRPGSPNGLYAFARGSILPDDRNFVSVTTEAGAVYKGIFRREKDVTDSLGLGFAYNGISDNVQHADNVARSSGTPQVPHLNFESALETTYSIPVNSLSAEAESRHATPDRVGFKKILALPFVSIRVHSMLNTFIGEP